MRVIFAMSKPFSCIHPAHVPHSALSLSSLHRCCSLCLLPSDAIKRLATGLKTAELPSSMNLPAQLWQICWLVKSDSNSKVPCVCSLCEISRLHRLHRSIVSACSQSSHVVSSRVSQQDGASLVLRRATTRTRATTVFAAWWLQHVTTHSKKHKKYQEIIVAILKRRNERQHLITQGFSVCSSSCSAGPFRSCFP